MFSNANKITYKSFKKLFLLPAMTLPSLQKYGAFKYLSLTFTFKKNEGEDEASELRFTAISLETYATCSRMRFTRPVTAARV